MSKNKKYQRIVPACLVLAFLSACTVDPRAYESTPVEIETAKGTVTCQLYTADITAWDRAIDRPENMSVEEGDQVCRAEGERRIAAQ